jgi:hypothetical protein
MSVLGDAVRSNADLHRALYQIVGTLAAADIAGRGDVPNWPYLCRLARASLPHLPPPPDRDAAQ